MTDLRREGASLRHKFVQRSHKNRPDVIVHVHVVANCRLCALLDVVDAAADVTAGDPEWWSHHPLGAALSRIASSQERTI